MRPRSIARERTDSGARESIRRASATAMRGWSGRRDSNPRHRVWKTRTLPAELLPPGCLPSKHARGPFAMAVRADDIAQSNLGQQTSSAVAEEPGDSDALRRWIAVVKLEHPRGKAAAAICARNVPQLVQECCVRPPAGTLILDPRPTGRRRPASGKTQLMLPPRSRSMTVRAHDVALGNLGRQAVVRREQRGWPTDPERFGSRIAMVEVHLMGLVSDPAIGARSRLQARDERKGARLSLANAGDLLVAMVPVVAPIRVGLVAQAGHD